MRRALVLLLLTVSGVARAQDPAADLAALTTEETPGETAAHPLHIYGFVDFSYFVPFWPEDGPFTENFPDAHNFAIGKLNLYLSKRVNERCGSLGEVRFLYEPHGARDATGMAYTSTETSDHADFNRPIRWGGVEIERVYVDCDLVGGLKLRVGQWLTPYGIWNVDHGTPALIALRVPFVIGEQLFPERQTGLQLHGQRSLGDFRLGYALTLSNGRGPIDAYKDLDRNKAIGGRLELQWTGLLDVTGGASYFRGRYTARSPRQLNIAAGNSTTTITEQFDEQAVGLDLAVNWRGLAFRGEYVVNEKSYTERGRPLARPGVYVPDGDRDGWYALLGYRLPWFGIMPYAMYLRLYPAEDPRNVFTARLWGTHYGVNVLLSPTMVLKIEYLRSGLIDPPPGPAALTEALDSIEAQLSWVF